MEFLLNPNLGYVLVVLTALLALAAIVVPGTGLAEASLLICLGLAGYIIYYLGINIWAGLVILLGGIPFAFSIRSQRGRLPLLGLALLCLMGGSLFLFLDENGWPAVHPLVAGLVSVLGGGFTWFAVERALAAQNRQPANDLGRLIGKVGESRTLVHAEGTVQVDGELWSARSEKPIAEGSAVRVVQREGFVLLVEVISK